MSSVFILCENFNILLENTEVLMVEIQAIEGSKTFCKLCFGRSGRQIYFFCARTKYVCFLLIIQYYKGYKTASTLFPRYSLVRSRWFNERARFRLTSKGFAFSHRTIGYETTSKLVLNIQFQECSRHKEARSIITYHF